MNNSHIKNKFPKGEDGATLSNKENSHIYNLKINGNVDQSDPYVKGPSIYKIFQEVIEDFLLNECKLPNTTNNYNHIKITH